MVKENKHILSDPLTNISKMSVKFDHVPNLHKVANVTAAGVNNGLGKFGSSGEK